MAGSENRHGSGAADGCSSFETTEGDVVFYDEDDGEAWIQSDRVVDLDDVRAVGPAE